MTSTKSSLYYMSPEYKKKERVVYGNLVMHLSIGDLLDFFLGPDADKLEVEDMYINITEEEGYSAEEIGRFEEIGTIIEKDMATLWERLQ